MNLAVRKGGAGSRGARERIAFGILCAGLVCLAGCGQSQLEKRYSAERDIWRTGQEFRRLQLRPTVTAEARAPLIRAYERILARYPMPASTDRETIESFARIRATAAEALSHLYLQNGSRTRAIGTLWDRRTEFPGSPSQTLRMYELLEPLLASGSSPDSLAEMYREMAENLPPANPDGSPVMDESGRSVVLEAPLHRAAVLAGAGRTADARAACTWALDWYDGVINAHRGTPTEVAAMVQKAQTLASMQRAPEAVALLTQARALPQAALPSVQAGLLYSLALLREQSFHDPRGAVALYRELLQKYPASSQVTLQAGFRLGFSLNAAGEVDAAVAAFDSLEKSQEKTVDIAAQARYQAACVLKNAGRDEESLRRLRSVATDFPRTELGLRAPLDIASYQQQHRDTTAAIATLREANSNYARLVADLKDVRDPGAHHVVLRALECLASGHEGLAVALGKNGGMEEWKAAADVLTQRAAAFPEDPQSPLALAQAAALLEEKLGDRDGSIHVLQTLVQNFPSSPFAAAARKKITDLGGPGS